MVLIEIFVSYTNARERELRARYIPEININQLELKDTSSNSRARRRNKRETPKHYSITTSLFFVHLLIHHHFYFSAMCFCVFDKDRTGISSLHLPFYRFLYAFYQHFNSNFFLVDTILRSCAHFSELHLKARGEGKLSS